MGEGGRGVVLLHKKHVVQKDLLRPTRTRVSSGFTRRDRRRRTRMSAFLLTLRLEWALTTRFTVPRG